MVMQIRYEEVLQHIQRGEQLLEVLPEETYEEQHIPGAVSIPLKELDQKAVAHLDPEKPTIVYCWDGL